MAEQRFRGSILSNEEIEAIKMTQGIISRIAGNSQKTKAAFIAICAAILTSAKAFDYIPVWKWFSVFMFITCILWYVDARYLQLERRLRKHHSAIIDGEIPSLDSWEPMKCRDGVPSVLRTMFSFSVLIYPCTAICAIFLFLF